MKDEKDFIMFLLEHRERILEQLEYHRQEYKKYKKQVESWNNILIQWKVKNFMKYDGSKDFVIEYK